MENDLKLHIKKLKRRAFVDFLAILIGIGSIGIGLLFIFVPLLKEGLFLLVFSIPFIIYIVISSKKAKVDGKKIYNPVVFKLSKSLTFSELVEILESLTQEANRMVLSDDVRFYRFKQKFYSRVILYKTDEFNKKDFDNQKSQINKKANKQFGTKQSFAPSEFGCFKRFNIIYTSESNDNLKAFFSRNTVQNLRRTETIFNIAVVGDEVIIPPLYGVCDYGEVSSYQKIVKLINKYINKLSE